PSERSRPGGRRLPEHGRSRGRGWKGRSRRTAAPCRRGCRSGSSPTSRRRRSGGASSRRRPRSSRPRPRRRPPRCRSDCPACGPPPGCGPRR
ncbi:MinD/ParA family protein, partial [Klebsiella pneumoniae]|nr:MinD/ParA family protein [Klebsiella pneumoniae]